MYHEEIEPHRETIDRLNNEIIRLLGERVQAAMSIGEIKKKHGKPVVDKTREQAILDAIRVKADENGMDPDGLERIFKEIIRLCVEAEENQ
jgi:chorismate mutase